MKPNFALDLSHDGIGLLHRAKSGWTLVGTVALDDPDMAARLADLRRSAAMLESGGFTTKLIIPNSQVLYTTVDAPGPDDIAREVQIRSALEGLTPYAVGDLVFDWRAEGDKARVAVLARETMDEAEAFAVEYKFNPVSFVARPDRGDFSGEPFFGKTREATRLLPPGTRVEPDSSPVPRNPRALELPAQSRVPEPETTPQSAPTEEPATPSEPPVQEAGNDRSDEPSPVQANEPAPAEGDQAEAKPKPRKKRKSRAHRKKVDPVSTPSLAPFPPTPDEIEDAPLATPRPILPKARGDEVVPAAAPPEAQAGPPTGAIPKAPGPIVSEDAAEIVTEPRDENEPEPATAAFQTSRAPGSTLETDANSANRLRGMAARIGIPGAAIPPAPPPIADVAADRPREKFTPPPLRLDNGQVSPGDPRRAKMAEALARPLPGRDETRDQGAAEKAPRPLAGLVGAARGVSERAGNRLKGAIETARNRVAARREARKAAASAPTTPEKDLGKKERASKKTDAGAKSSRRAEEEAQRKREAEALTVFGARQSQDVRGRPRYLGLILTLLLLLVMAIIAIWSITAIPESETSLFNPAPVESADATPEPAEPDVPASPAPQADGTTPAPSPAEEVPAPEVLSADAAQARYAATGIWQRAPEPLVDPGASRLDEFDIAGLNPAAIERVPAPSPGDLPGGFRDALLATPLPPPPPGTRFDLDENGLVRPTPEGALSPTGILVFSGKPPVVPPPRPGGPAEPQAGAAPAGDETLPVALPGVPNLRPRPRPADLETFPTPDPGPEPAPAETPDAPAAAETAPETDDNAELGDDTAPADPGADIALAAAIRPSPRPEDVVVSTSSPNAAIEAAIDDAVEEAFADASELAVASSRLPTHRPANFATIVDAARDAASDGSSVVAAAAPATTAPAIPTTANVATRATVANAINLREINLIGIYGTSNARRALVRLKSGRYVKVKVGDRLDGGQVTSITATELTYQKGRRAYKLAVLPLG